MVASPDELKGNAWLNTTPSPPPRLRLLVLANGVDGTEALKPGDPISVLPLLPSVPESTRLLEKWYWSSVVAKAPAAATKPTKSVRRREIPLTFISSSGSI